MARRGWSFAILGLLVLAGTVSCSFARGVPDHLPATDWGNPIPGGESFTSASDAARVLAFVPIVPSVVIGLQSIVTSPRSIPLSAMTVAFVYRDQAMGRFAIEEWISQETLAEFQAQLQYNSDPSNTETLSIVKLDSGQQALLAVGPNTTYVQQIHGNLLVMVIGPSSTFSAADAVAVANKIPVTQDS